MAEYSRNNNVVKRQEKINPSTTLRVDTEPRQSRLWRIPPKAGRRGECIKLKCFFLLFIFFAVQQAFGQNRPVTPQKDSKAEASFRPKVEYLVEKSKDPFYNYVKAETHRKIAGMGAKTAQEEKVDLAKFIVQGIIWGGQLPQAIINERVLTIGDVIEESRIETIDKSGVTLSRKTQIFKLTSPASGQRNNDAKN